MGVLMRRPRTPTPTLFTAAPNVGLDDPDMGCYRVYEIPETLDGDVVVQKPRLCVRGREELYIPTASTHDVPAGRTLSSRQKLDRDWGELVFSAVLRVITASNLEAKLRPKY